MIIEVRYLSGYCPVMSRKSKQQLITVTTPIDDVDIVVSGSDDDLYVDWLAVRFLCSLMFLFSGLLLPHNFRVQRCLSLPRRLYRIRKLLLQSSSKFFDIVIIHLIHLTRLSKRLSAKKRVIKWVVLFLQPIPIVNFPLKICRVCAHTMCHYLVVVD